MQQAFNMMDLPQVLTEPRFAHLLSVKANGLGRMVDEGTLPMPTARDGEKAVWMESDVVDWFSTLQGEQSAYASIDLALGQQELQSLGAYVCPARSSQHIGQRRPVKLALYTSGLPKTANGTSYVTVYDVDWIQTQDGVMGEQLIWHTGARKPVMVPWQTVRPGDDTPLTLFKLDLESAQTIEVGRAWQRGGTVKTDSLQLALSNGYASHFKGGIAHP